MLLSAVKTNIEALSDRNVEESVFLLAARQVINDIERRDQGLIHTERETLAADGSSLYTTPTNADRRNTLKIFYLNNKGEPTELLERDEVIVPATPGRKVHYYEFIGKNTLQLDGSPTDGSLLFRIRAYRDPLLVSVDVGYDALTVGIRYWLGTNYWEDSRTKQWEAEYTMALDAMLKAMYVRSSNIKTMGERDDYQC
jgi:hypothetical protein